MTNDVFLECFRRLKHKRKYNHLYYNPESCVVNFDYGKYIIQIDNTNISITIDDKTNIINRCSWSWDIKGNNLLEWE